MKEIKCINCGKVAPIQVDGVRFCSLGCMSAHPDGWRRSTLCWRCKKSSGPMAERCSWARSFKPVKGWEAEPVPLRTSSRAPAVLSYLVIGCPEFEREERKNDD